MSDNELPRIMGLFQKRIDGDDALLHLAKIRFKESGLCAEFYADTLDELDWLLKFKPVPESSAVAHLHRGINLLEEESQRLITDFASAFAGQIYGLVIHDQIEMAASLDDYLSAVYRIESELKEINQVPYLFIEYAVGLEPDRFLEFFKRIHHLERVSACLDIGHIGLWQVRDAFRQGHPGVDICAFAPHDPRLKQVIGDIGNAVNSALPIVISVVHALGRLGKPLHFHLHDGHPLSSLSPFGISDHISFLSEIPIPFEYNGEHVLLPMFGPSGLSEIVDETLKTLSPDLVSFTLEIHPEEGRIPLSDASHLFYHWTDKTNAERMNYWLSVLKQNYRLLLDACKSSGKNNFTIYGAQV